eukprot:TRINITY_DN5115_c0_g3_i1.p1 TRINITY_DN5115_c0_g3~~TRINITY_DN5115_c0_g3_i1.p1  ORF type:complete len:146 (-),score=8.12 TRINITY_DN5115_c0_g3_i1:553-990(-)
MTTLYARAQRLVDDAAHTTVTTHYCWHQQHFHEAHKAQRPIACVSTVTARLACAPSLTAPSDWLKVLAFFFNHLILFINAQMASWKEAAQLSFSAPTFAAYHRAKAGNGSGFECESARGVGSTSSACCFVLAYHSNAHAALTLLQ